ncbi:MAG: T9SS type A sorting domain-containing protein [Flavipsychrobacter sp.]|nr:T9SS type A sorting domain-containing protein [Flavipsychrobacter sp.]
MQKNIYIKLLVLLSLLLSAQVTNAQNGNKALSEMVAKAHANGTNFAGCNLFTVINAPKHTALLKEETILRPDAGKIAAMYETQPAAIEVKIKDAYGKEYVLEMMKSSPAASDANFGYMTHQGQIRQRMDNGIHYQGAISGKEGSLAAMSVFSDGSIMALFADKDGNYVLGKLEDNSGNYILYNDKDMLMKQEMPCGVRETGKPYDYRPQSGHNKTTGVNMCRKVQLYWECDYQFFQNKGSLVNAQNHMTGLFNQVQALYKNDNISIELKSLYIWTTDDGYPFNTSSDGLDIFKGYWNSRLDGFDGDIAHFITMDASSNGGLAYLDVLDVSSRSFAYAYSEIHSTYSPIPTYSWSVMVLSHETGHNMGSKHTHWCGWATGPGGSCGSIDNCTTQETDFSCGTPCFKTWDNALPSGSWSGSVMSYCHLTSRGIGLANGFGPLPGALIRNNVTNTSNLKSVISANLIITPICNNNGAITLIYNADNFGVAPYTYTWSNGGNTKNISSLSTAGSYNVTVTDSNNCTNTFTTNLVKFANPGNGKATGYNLPVCCYKGPVTVTLSADLPTDIQACQTVAWLKTTGALSNYAAAQTAFASAAPSDIIYSTNSSSVSNSTAATLNITSPNPCSKQTYYYTPFITRKPKLLNNITSSATVNSPVYQDVYQIGSGVSLPDQTATATVCDLADTATAKTLSVTVTNYTGRANNLTIIAQTPAGGNQSVWYRKTGLAGNGTYTIPLTDAPNILGAIEVLAFDFNCSNSGSCVSSSVTLSATRTVTYQAITSPRFEGVCASGTSVKLSFSPDSCEFATGVSAIANEAPAFLSVYPNPANQSVMVKFYSGVHGTADLKITDMLGKKVYAIPVKYETGDNYIPVNVGSWAKGVYFISLPIGNRVENCKLIVE